MNNPRIVIDPGHGGSDNGATGNGIIEKDMNLAISQYMYKRFKELGIPVTLTRTTDEIVTPTERVKRILAAYGNDPNVIVISNHINAGGGDGAEVIYALRNNATLANQILDEIKNAGQNTRKAFQRRLPSDTSKDYYFIHRDTGVTQPVIVEYGFLDSTGDDPKQLKENYEKYAEAVVKAVMTYLGKYYNPVVGANDYVVKSGDSLWSIANRFNTTVDELKKLNNLPSNALRVGQILKLPTNQEGPSTEEEVYVVKNGDSLYKIANQFGVSVADLRKWNNLANDNLTVGQVLNISGPSTPTPPVGTNTYTVKSGDSLYSIARKFDTTVDDLIALNNLKTSLLNLGQVLKIPNQGVSNPNETTYTVKSGDSLWNIAQRFNTTVSAIRAKNNLKTDSLTIGQTLKI